jgi:hypothetical protein
MKNNQQKPYPETARASLARPGPEGGTVGVKEKEASFLHLYSLARLFTRYRRQRSGGADLPV